MTSELSKIWNYLQKVTTETKSIAEDILVVFVANRKTFSTNSLNDRNTEYFSDFEANQLLTGFRISGFKTLYFEGENEFISYVIKKERMTNAKWVIVYNTAQSGSDPGRKSLLPSFCSLHNIHICNSNSYVVSLARNKFHVHAILRCFGVPTPNSWLYSADSGWLKGETPPSKTNLIAKAVHESASIGLDYKSIGEISKKYESILMQKSEELKQPLIVQKFITGKEFEVPVINMNSQRLPLNPVSITINGNDELYDQYLSYDTIYNDRYGFGSHSSEYASVAENMRKVAADVCEILGINGFARVDFRVDNEKNIWVTDVSTSPHIVQHSAYNYAFNKVGWTHNDLLACMIAVNAKIHNIIQVHSDHT